MIIEIILYLTNEIVGLYAGPVVGFFLGGLITKYWGHYSIYTVSGKIKRKFILFFVDLKKKQKLFQKYLFRLVLLCCFVNSIAN